MVMFVLVVLFVVLPLTELYMAIEVGRWIGAPETIALLLAISVFGAWLARRQGLAVLGRVRAQLDAGRIPGRDLMDGLLVLIAGTLLLIPGFITDAIGLLLLLPPARAGARWVLFRRWRRRVQRVSSTWTVVSGVPAGGDGSSNGTPPPALESSGPEVE
ncbi:MAG: FxsA family protein [Acidimicrobiia bacterium]|nr:FxsA family protein [Acidimicrobiia bacterium]